MTRGKSLTDGEFWADKLMDLANLTVVLLVFGQFVGSKIYWSAVGLGLFIYIFITIIAYKLRRKG